jgi:hypothetical protein
VPAFTGRNARPYALATGLCAPDGHDGLGIGFRIACPRAVYNVGVFHFVLRLGHCVFPDGAMHGALLG